MSPAVLFRCASDQRPHHAALVQRLGLAWEEDAPAAAGSTAAPGATHVLEAGPLGLCLHGPASADSTATATRVDFLDPALLYRLRTSGKRQGLGQALGLHRHPAPLVLDATAGLGRDALLMAHLGCEVLMLERSPLVHALLEDGLARALAAGDEPLLSAALPRLRLQHGEARHWLAAVLRGEQPQPDVVYLDPMFPPRNKSAKVKKDMALLQELLGAEEDFPSLLQAACAAARLRVVVKRPGHRPDLTLPPPTFTVPGKTAQFEVYELSSRQASIRS